MSLIDKIKALFNRKKAMESDKKSLESESIQQENRFESIEKQTTIVSNQSISSDNKSIENRSLIDLNQSTENPNKETQLLLEQKEEEIDELTKGITIGYGFRSIKEIENSIIRIESNMPSKEWLKNELNEYFLKLLESIKIAIKAIEEHEKLSKERYESIESALNRLEELSIKITDESQKQQILQEIRTIRSNLPLTSKMQKVLEIIKEVKEISYEELAQRLGISVSALRGLLSNMSRRTDKIERFEKDNKGWVRYIDKQEG